MERVLSDVPALLDESDTPFEAAFRRIALSAHAQSIKERRLTQVRATMERLGIVFTPTTAQSS